MERSVTRLYHVDAFAAAPFTGNPAGVCLLDDAAPEAWMTAVAAEMNLSETAFLVAASPGEYALRWFTPKKEVAICGHATLAASHVLWEDGIVAAEEIRFSTLSGALTARRRHAAGAALIELDFPARIAAPAAENPAVSRALGASPTCTSVFPTPHGPVYILELASEAAVRALHPDFGALLETGARAVAATSVSLVPGCDFTTRYFAPAVGINEDPVTGSIHCSLAPYWAGRLGRRVLTGYQASARGGTVGCRWEGERVILSGTAVTVYRAGLTA